VEYDPNTQSAAADIVLEVTLDFIRRARLDRQEDSSVVGFLNRTLSVLVARLGAYIVQFKHASYREENEWRLIALRRSGAEDVRFRASRFGLTPMWS
jgi:hypothetical protein